MARGSDTVRLPLESLRRQVAEATGRSASFVDITGVEVDGNALEVSFRTPDEDVPIVEIVVEGPEGHTQTTSARLDAPAGLRVFGELLRVEYAGRDAETGAILVSVAQRVDDDWQTLLGCGQMWAVETDRDGEAVTVTCHVETPHSDRKASSDASGNSAESADEDDAPNAGDGGLLNLD